MGPEHLTAAELLRHIEQDHGELLHQPLRYAWQDEQLATLLTRAHDDNLPKPDVHNNLKQRRDEIGWEIRELEQQIEDLQDEADEVEEKLSNVREYEDPFKYCEWCDRPLQELLDRIYELSQLELEDES